MTTHIDAPLAILPALQRLDALLARAAGLACERHATESDDPESRGLVSALAEVKLQHLVARQVNQEMVRVLLRRHRLAHAAQ